jgi:hypothetical protein
MNMLSRSSGGRRMWGALLFAVLVTGAAAAWIQRHLPRRRVGPGAPAHVGPAVPPPIQAYDTAVLSAAAALFKNARLPVEGSSPGRRYLW